MPQVQADLVLCNRPGRTPVAASAFSTEYRSSRRTRYRLGAFLYHRYVDLLRVAVCHSPALDTTMRRLYSEADQVKATFSQKVM